MLEKEYFGYIEPFYNTNKELYPDSLKLNAARYCIDEQIRSKKYSKVFIPYYMCSSVFDEIKAENLRKYRLQSGMVPFFDEVPQEGDLIIYPNYFGIYDARCEEVIKEYAGVDIMLDNTQAFYHFSDSAAAICYSPRKFFEVTDGAYLISKQEIELPYERDFSADRYHALLLRCERGAGAGYQGHLNAEKELADLGPKRMSALTSRILKQIDYPSVRARRRSNFNLLHAELHQFNELQIPDISNFECPMVYPLLVRHDTLTADLVKKHVFVPRWWATVKDAVPESWYEAHLSQFLVPLPVDQRYDESDMKKIADLVRDIINGVAV